MLDFVNVTVLKGRNETVVRPDFVTYRGREPVHDIMIKGGDFYAFWDENNKDGLWSKDVISCYLSVDDMTIEAAKAVDDEKCKIMLMQSSSSGLAEQWKKYVRNELRDTYVQLDSRVTFLNDIPKREDYRSKKLPYAIQDGSIKNWNRILSTLYDESERMKIEWAIGAIVSGDSTQIQKFLVFYGPAGAGKSTVMNIINGMFEDYVATFDSMALTSANAQFSLEPFKNNPLVAIQQDGDMSKITDNSRLNSLVSHERMNVNEKHKALYEMQFRAFLFVGTNRPVHITDPKSGLNRRLIDVTTSGRTLDHDEYRRVVEDVKFEYGAIAKHCLDVYLSNPDRYDKYVPTRMITATNDLYNYILDSYNRFTSDDKADIRTVWPAYKHWAEDANVYRVLSKREFREQLKDYFNKTDNEDPNLYLGFKKEKFKKDNSEVTKEVKKVAKGSWLKFEECDPNINEFNILCNDCPAQYASDTGIPRKPWDNVSSTLADINTSELHYVRVPETHIVIDFDIPGENGEKDLARNIEEASKWPPTYAELSKSGGGVHLHYIYNGDPTKLSAIYDDKVEIKVFLGKQALRRKLSLCNNIPITTISSGLPLKKEVNPVVEANVIEDEKHLRAIIKKALRREVHDSTRCSIDFIAMILEKAYTSGQKYDVSDMHQDVFNFASGSTHQASYCIKKVSDMKFKSDEPSDYVDIGDGAPLCFFDIEVFPNLFLVCWKLDGMDEVFAMVNPKPEEIEKLFRYRLVGFNNRKYDNHLVYACFLGYSVEELYQMSQNIINEGRGFIGEAYNLSYTDIYDYMANKMSLKKLELEMGIRHLELGLPWDQPAPEELWDKIIEYCKNDVTATEAGWYYTQADFTARMILADLAGGCPNDTTNSLTTKFIFGAEKNPQHEFYYRDLSKPVFESDMDPESIEFLKEVFPEMMAKPHGEAGSMLPYFPGYKYEFGKSTYLGETAGEGGFAEGVPGYYTNVPVLDIMSMHPHSAMTEVIFGPRFTRAFHQIVYGRVHIKHKAWDIVDTYLDGKLKPYIEKCKAGEMSNKELANALKIAINSVYGLTAASFDNPFHDPRNVDNIVAKRGALFMIELKHTLIEKGYTVAHIKTDSIKLPNASPELIQFVMDFGKRYGYTFEHECTYEKMVLVNDAVYIAKYASAESCEKMYGYVPGDNVDHGGQWTATGTQFQIPFVFKKLFSKEKIEFEDLCSTFSVSKGALYLDMDECEDIRLKEQIEDKLKKLESKQKKDPSSVSEEEIETLRSSLTNMRHFKFVGRVSQFVPIKPGCGGGVLLRVADDKVGAASGTKGFRWLESAEVEGTSMEDNVDIEYWRGLADKAIESINQYVPYDLFVSEDVAPFEKGKCMGNCERCPYMSLYPDTVFGKGMIADCTLPFEDSDEWRLIAEKRDYVLSTFCAEHDYMELPF